MKKNGALTPLKFRALAKDIGLKMEGKGKDMIIYSNYLPDHTCPVGATVSRLADKDVFGDQWFEFSEVEQEDIWHALYFFDDSAQLEDVCARSDG